MKKEHKLLRLLCFAILPCVAAALLSGCTPGVAKVLMTVTGNAPNPKVQEVDGAWLNQFAVPGKTKDVDILHKLCKPYGIHQFSTGEKSYIYWGYKDSSASLDATKSVVFTFNPDHTLQETPPVESAQFFFRYSKITSDKDLLVFLETLPAKATAQVLKKRLGEPSMVLGNRWGYTFTMEYSERMVLFYLGEGDMVEYMSVPQGFYEYAMRNRAHFNINMVYDFKRSPDERELAAIEGCEK